MGNSLVLERTEVQVESVSCLSMDFNSHFYCKSVTDDIVKDSKGIKILSGNQGDILLITKTSKEHDYYEGYLAKDKNRNLGLVHAKFVTPL
mmetsp:Transcript_28327/g.25028  ORF Transcript_28327/g.25028 Transcript_28327/m.25028 type:complete len:91 (+) Transcript_28327:1250-1522(+)